MSNDRTYAFSTLLRDPKTVTAAADRGDVRIERRDGADFVVRTVERDQRERTGMTILATALRSVPLQDVVTSLAAPGGLYPWVRFLPDADRLLFAQELLEALQVSQELGSFSGVALTLDQWRETAEIWTDPALAESLSSPIENPHGTPVPQP